MQLLAATVSARGQNRAAFISRHYDLVAYGIMVVSLLFIVPVFDAEIQVDVNLYQRIANDLITGLLPYRDRIVEYPPYAIPIFLLPRVFGGNHYFNGFVGVTFITGWLMQLWLFAFCRQLRTARALMPLLLYCASIPCIRFFFLQRFDIYPALICGVAVWLFCSKRYFLCGLAIALGLGVKLYPALFVPPLWVLAMRQGRSKSFISGLVVGLLPMVLLGFFLPWWRFIEFQSARGLQVESVYASILWLGNHLGVVTANWEFVTSWFEVTGKTASTILPWARLTFIGTVGFSTSVAIWAAARYPDSRVDTMSVSRLSRLLLLPLLAFVAFNQVLSPQYLIWLMPMAASASLEGNLKPALLIALATMLTPIIYPSFHDNYTTGLSLFETVVLLTRNLILILAWGLLVWETLRAFSPKNRSPEAS